MVAEYLWICCEANGFVLLGRARQGAQLLTAIVVGTVTVLPTYFIIHAINEHKELQLDRQSLQVWWSS